MSAYPGKNVPDRIGPASLAVSSAGIPAARASGFTQTECSEGELLSALSGMCKQGYDFDEVKRLVEWWWTSQVVPAYAELHQGDTPKNALLPEASAAYYIILPFEDERNALTFEAKLRVKIAYDNPGAELVSTIVAGRIAVDHAGTPRAMRFERFVPRAHVVLASPPPKLKSKPASKRVPTKQRGVKR